jgi:nucleoside-diphosphate-sugar epimerase
MPTPPLPADDLHAVLEKTRPLWAEARGQSFFITGGTGFFGRWLLESFAYINDALGLGMRATVLSRDPAAFSLKAPHLAARGDITFVGGDIRTFAFPEGSFPYLIHAATEASATLNERAPEEMFDSIVDGTRRVLSFAAQAGTRKLLFTSSGAVYGRQPSGLNHVEEDYAGAPDSLSCLSAYGEGKRAAELLCTLRARRSGFELKVARCFAFVGPHLPLNSTYAIGNFLRDAAAGRPVVVEGDGTPWRSYLYASDLAEWLWTLLFVGPAGQAINVGSGRAHSLREVAQLVARVGGNPASVIIKRQPLPGQPHLRYVPSVSKARDVLGLEAHIDLETAIVKTLDWIRTTTIYSVPDLPQ